MISYAGSALEANWIHFWWCFNEMIYETFVFFCFEINIQNVNEQHSWKQMFLKFIVSSKNCLLLLKRVIFLGYMICSSVVSSWKRGFSWSDRLKAGPASVMKMFVCETKLHAKIILWTSVTLDL